MSDTPLVSVAMLSFQHERFIAQAIDGVLSQRTRFRYELVIGEDGSTDGTLAICREYEKQHPDSVVVISTGENVSRGGVSRNLLRTCLRCRGKYVAFCEGDDYWTDPFKLQKQVDYMESHPDCTISFHPVLERWEDGGGVDGESPANWRRFLAKAPSFDELLHGNFIRTCSVMYRWNPDGKLFLEFPLKELPGDWVLHLAHARNGVIGFMPDVMAVYRRHIGSLWSRNWESEEWFRKFGYRVALFYRRLERDYGVDRHVEIRRLVLASLAVAPQKEELLAIMRPSALWVRCAWFFAFCYGVAGLLVPKSLCDGFHRRRFTWALVNRRGKDIVKLLSAESPFAAR